MLFTLNKILSTFCAFALEVDLAWANKLSSSFIIYRSNNLQLFKNWLKLIEYQSVKQNKVASVAHSVAVLKSLRQLLTFSFYSSR